jgi:hypothetical protein
VNKTSSKVGADLTDEALPGEWTLDEIATHRERLRNLYVDALRDDDGRVRRAAAKAIKELALTAEMLKAEDELRSMMDELNVCRGESVSRGVTSGNRGFDRLRHRNRVLYPVGC